MTVATKPDAPRETVSGERAQQLVAFREIEQLLATGFTGRIVLHCHQGQIPRYTIEETRQPGKTT